MCSFDRLTESELIDLNYRIVARLRMFTELRAHASMLQFKLGERVSFDAEDGRRITGMLVRRACGSKTAMRPDRATVRTRTTVGSANTRWLSH